MAKHIEDKVKMVEKPGDVENSSERWLYTIRKTVWLAYGQGIIICIFKKHIKTIWGICKQNR